MKKFLFNEDGVNFAEWGLLLVAVVALAALARTALTGVVTGFINGITIP